MGKNLSLSLIDATNMGRTWGSGGGLVVSILAFYSDNPSSNPDGYLIFLYQKTKINEKEAGVGPSVKWVDLKKMAYFSLLHQKIILIDLAAKHSQEAYHSLNLSSWVNYT